MDKKRKQLNYGILLSYLSMALGILINFVYTPILLKRLGQDEYGLYTLASSVASYLTLFNFGFASAYIYFYSRYAKKNDDENVARLNGMFVKLFSTISFIVLLVGLILSKFAWKWFSDNLTTEQSSKFGVLILILSFNVIVHFYSSIFSAYITANEKFIFLKLIMMISEITKPIVTLLLLFVGWQSIGVAIALLIVSILVCILYGLYCLLKLKMCFSFKKTESGIFNELLSYTGLVFIIMIVDQVNWGIDKVLLGIFKGTVAVAIYGLASQLNNLFMQFSTNISSVYTPRVHLIQAGNEREEIKNTRLTEIMIEVGRMQFVILSLVFTGFLCFGRQFISIWAGAEYDESYIALIILFGSEMIPLFLNVGIEIQRAKNKQKIPTLVAVIQAIINLIISIPLCKAYGVVGCSLGTAIAMIMASAFKVYYYDAQLGVNMKRFGKAILRILPSIIIACSVGLLLASLIKVDTYLMLFASIFAYTLVYCLIVFVLGLSKTQRSSVAILIKQRIRPGQM